MAILLNIVIATLNGGDITFIYLLEQESDTKHYFTTDKNANSVELEIR